MRRALTAAVVAFGALTAVPARAQATLNIGDPAPKLEVKEFVKGQPVKAFEAGKTYVVEFWATWCGPCRVSIPHLSELQKKYPSITFVGVSVWETNQKDVKPFVEQMGPKMDYRVAIDVVAAGASGNDGKMAKNWMTAAGERGIPSAFVVNGEGKIAWIGHPMAMDEPLAKIAQGQWDLKAAAAERQQERAQEEKLQALGARLQKAPDSKARLAVVDEALTGDPGLVNRVGMFKLNLMVETNADGIAAFVTKLSETFKGNAQALNAIAWQVLDPKRAKPATDVAKAALATAQQADKAAGEKDPAIADTLARAYFLAGNPAMAVAAQERAIKLAAGTDLAKDPTLNQRLQEYKKAAAL